LSPLSLLLRSLLSLLLCSLLGLLLSLLLCSLLGLLLSLLLRSLLLCSLLGLLLSLLLYCAKSLDRLIRLPSGERLPGQGRALRLGALRRRVVARTRTLGKARRMLA
jgi:hypothetical protein